MLEYALSRWRACAAVLCCSRDTAAGRRCALAGLRWTSCNVLRCRGGAEGQRSARNESSWGCPSETVLPARRRRTRSSLPKRASVGTATLLPAHSRRPDGSGSTDAYAEAHAHTCPPRRCARRCLRRPRRTSLGLAPTIPGLVAPLTPDHAARVPLAPGRRPRVLDPARDLRVLPARGCTARLPRRRVGEAPRKRPHSDARRDRQRENSTSSL